MTGKAPLPFDASRARDIQWLDVHGDRVTVLFDNGELTVFKAG